MSIFFYIFFNISIVIYIVDFISMISVELINDTQWSVKRTVGGLQMLSPQAGPSAQSQLFYNWIFKIVLEIYKKSLRRSCSYPVLQIGEQAILALS